MTTLFAKILITVRNEVAQGYVFTPACHSVHGWGGVCLRIPPPWEQTPPREQAGIPPGTRHPPGTRLPPADGYCCGLYASYWNAILVKHIFKTTRVLKDCICSGLLTPPSHTAMEWSVLGNELRYEKTSSFLEKHKKTTAVCAAWK